MEQVRKSLEALAAELAVVLEGLHIDALAAEHEALQTQMAAADFWQNPARAQRISQQESKLRKRIEPWQVMQHELADARELAALDDVSMTGELAVQAARLDITFEALKAELRFAGAYD